MERQTKFCEADVASLTTCDPSQQVRHLENTLYTRGEEESNPLASLIEYTPLNNELAEVRLLRLHPASNVSQHVRYDLQISSLSLMPPFIAIQNTRAYRNVEEAIEIVHADTRHAVVISAALERFLRYLRTIFKEPIHIWVRYACVLEYNLKKQQTYWTRGFSDKMYAAASLTFNMHEINDRLVENGYFERCIISEYRN